MINRLLSKACIILSLLSIAYAESTPKLPDVGFHKERSTHEAYAKRYIISTQGEASSRAGKEMFALGGNAIDAAAAISFAIAVERPQSTGIAGGGFMLIRFAEKSEMIAVDFRETAPKASTAAMFLDAQGEVIPGKSTEGIFSVAVPGMVAGVLEIQSKYGKLSRA